MHRNQKLVRRLEPQIFTRMYYIFRRTLAPKSPWQLNYSIPRDKGYEGGVERVWVPGDTQHAPNYLNILPILSPETRDMKEAFRGVGLQETHPMH
jgi:hypothetical protein